MRETRGDGLEGFLSQLGQHDWRPSLSLPAPAREEGNHRSCLFRARRIFHIERANGLTFARRLVSLFADLPPLESSSTRL